MVNLLGVTMASASEETPRFKACDLVDDQIVKWVYNGEPLTVRTSVNNIDGQGPETILTIIDANGRQFLKQNGANFTGDEPLNSDIIACDYHLYMASQSTLSTLKGDGISLYGINVKTGDDIVDILEAADHCDRMKSKYVSVKDRETKCKWVTAQAELFKTNPDWETGKITQLLQDNAPIIVVSESYYNSDIFIFDARQNQFLRLGPMGGC